MADELAQQWVGPMPVHDFTKAFLDVSAAVLSQRPKFEADHFETSMAEAQQSEVSDQFIAAVEAASVMPRLKLLDTSCKADNDRGSGINDHPDISCYRQGIEVEIESTVGRFKDVELIFAFQPSNEPADPFDDDADKMQPGGDFAFEPEFDANSVKHRAQLSHYAQIWSFRQYRTHCFIIWLAGSEARIIRIDRSGGIVSAKFNYRKEGNILLGFLWRFSQSDDEARGRDITVSEASAEETALGKEALREWTPTREKPVYKVQVPDPLNDTKYRPVLVWHSLAGYQSAAGKGTRGSPGLDLQGNGGRGAIVFVKDAWRCNEAGTEKETTILKDLNDKKCRNVPELICGDDLPHQHTRTKDYVQQPWNVGALPEALTHRAHIRFAQDLIGYDLWTFKSSRQVVQAAYDAAIAHKDAYEKCGILHRDISEGNILLTMDGGGFLNDWDWAKRIDRDVPTPRFFRAGTWQFMSSDLLKNPEKINSLQDDLESFFWVILYESLRYMRHNQMDGLQKKMAAVFDEQFSTAEGPTCGGRYKAYLIYGRFLLGFGFSIHENRPLTILIVRMANLWMKRTQKIHDYEGAIAMAEMMSDISSEEARARRPFDDTDLPMRNHDDLIAVLEEVLAIDAWPQDDGSVDNFLNDEGY